MKGKIRGYTGQIGFYKVPEEMKNSLTYTSPFIDFFKEITDFKFHTSPPQDVFYHPIENRVDTTPVLFYWKITFTNYDGYQTDYNWSSSSTGSFSLSYHQAQFQIFHPYANIRRIELQDIEVNDEGNEIRTINSGVFYYNSSHLYSYTFPDNCIRRVIRLKFFRWEDSTPYIANITIHNEEYNFHRYPPQDVFYHPIESRVDTTPSVFYYKIIFYDPYDTQINETPWLTTSTSFQLPFYKAKIRIFHPYSNIRRFTVENRRLSDNTLLQSVDFYYNSSHLYEYLFTIDDASMERQVNINAYRWEDNTPTTLQTQLRSTVIFTKIEYSTDEDVQPSTLFQDWTAQGGNYTFGFVKTRLHFKSTVNVNINGTDYSQTGSIDYNVHSGNNNMSPTITYNITTVGAQVNGSKTVSITSNGLLAKVYNDNTPLTQWINEDRTITINSAGRKSILFCDLPTPNQRFTLFLGNAQAYIEITPQRKRTISLNLQRSINSDVYYLSNRQVISNLLSVYFEKGTPLGTEYPFLFYAYENSVMIIGVAKNTLNNQTIATFSRIVNYGDNQWYNWNNDPSIRAIYVGYKYTLPYIKINCYWGNYLTPVSYQFLLVRPPLIGTPGVFTVEIIRNGPTPSFLSAKYEVSVP